MAVFDNDRLSNWVAGAVLTWILMFLLWGLLLFQIVLKVPTATIGTFCCLGCVMQMAITPWLFSARATPQNPKGLYLRRALAITVWFTGIGLLFCYFLQRGLPKDADSGLFVAIAYGVTASFGVVCLVAVGMLSRRRKHS
jgi:hypothetical protein